MSADRQSRSSPERCRVHRGVGTRVVRFRPDCVIATVLVSVFAVVAIVLGYEAIALLDANSVYKTKAGWLIGGGSMPCCISRIS